MKTYKLSLALQITVTVICALATAGAAYGIGEFLQRDPVSTPGILFMAAVMLACVIAMIYIFSIRLTVSEDSIHDKSLFTDRTLSFSDIKGYTTSTHRSSTTLELVPEDPSLRSISISSGLNGYHEIVAWATARYPDLDMLARKAALENPALGASREEVEARLKRAQKLCGAMTVTAVGLIIASLFDDLWEYALVLAMILPLGATVLAHFHKGFISLEMGKSIPFPSIYYAVIVCAGLLAFCALKMHIVSHAGVWTPMIVTAVAIGGLLLWGVGRTDLISVLLAISVALPYGYGTAMFANILGDQGEVEEYSVTVLDKWFVKGKSKTYYLRLDAWGPKPAGEEEMVPRRLYNAVEKGSSVQVTLHSGYLNIPWYTISELHFTPPVIK